MANVRLKIKRDGYLQLNDGTRPAQKRHSVVCVLMYYYIVNELCKWICFCKVIKIWQYNFRIVCIQWERDFDGRLYDEHCTYINILCIVAVADEYIHYVMYTFPLHIYYLSLFRPKVYYGIAFTYIHVTNYCQTNWSLWYGKAKLNWIYSERKSFYKTSLLDSIIKQQSKYNITIDGVLYIN